MPILRQLIVMINFFVYIVSFINIIKQQLSTNCTSSAKTSACHWLVNLKKKTTTKAKTSNEKNKD